MYTNPVNMVVYNFIRRYNWQAADFRALQQTLIQLPQGTFEGLIGAAVLEGLPVTTVSGMSIQAGTGIAVGPSGYLDVVTQVSNLSVPVPASGTARNLVVVRPNVVNATTVNDPVIPNQTDVLTKIQEAVVLVLQGVASNTPTYPAIQNGDTVLCGIRSTAGQSSLADADYDFEVRDSLGKNSTLHQETGGKFDDRLRVYLQSMTTIGIKPSQLEPPLPRAFSYVNQGTPSAFPLSGGAYNPADTFVNMQTGVVSGGDTTTSSPIATTIPTAGNAIVATISVKTDDTLAISYGTQGTRAQCLSGIKSQKLTGSGCIAFSPNTKPIAFVVVYSADGSNVTELDFFDCRSKGGTISSNTTPLLTQDEVAASITIASGFTMFYPTMDLDPGVTVDVEGKLITVGEITGTGTIIGLGTVISL